jgi:2OG-Fe(II) oxygenase superfamily
MMLVSSTLFPLLVTFVGTKQTVNAAFMSSKRHQPIPILLLLQARIKSQMKRSLFSSSSTGTFITERNALVEELAQEFDPLRPPSHLASLRVGESYKISIMDDDTGSSRELSVTRLSRNPDIFLVPNFIAQTERLIDAANNQGLTVAGIRKSQSNTFRTHSYITWLGDNNDYNDNEDGAFKENDDGRYRGLVKGITDLCNALFVHESLQIRHGLHSKEDQDHQQQSSYVAAEDMQIAKYDSGGSFTLHHDGFSRFLTVLTYLNGVGGTYFPLAQTKHRDTLLSPTPKLCMNDDGSLSSNGYEAGKDGLLIVGKEGETAYLDDENDSHPIVFDDSAALVRIQAGDAVVFYNYNLLMKDDNTHNITNGISDGHDDPKQTKKGELDDAGQHNKEWRAVHAALPVPQEKWIATNWFRSEALTGPFAHLYRERLLSDTSHE